MNELLLEILSGEIPAKDQFEAAKAYKLIFKDYFDKYQLSYAEIKLFVGPRRITLLATNLKNEHSNINVSDILKRILPEALNKYSWRKSMHWGSNTIKWIRPIYNILCIFNREVVNFKYGHLIANNITYGHRAVCRDRIEIINFAHYYSELKKYNVIVDHEERKEKIRSKLEEEVKKLNLKLNFVDLLLDEVTGLVEYPIVLLGKINPKFLSIPSEILITSMQINQKYFAITDHNNKLAPYFLFVANINGNESSIIAGNEKVLSARLEDALYLYNKDLEIGSKKRIEKLKTVIFHNVVGNLFDKSERLAKICNYLSQSDKILTSAALLCKNDIVSEVVSEFPSLHGIIGYHYAIAENFDHEVAEIILDYYQPKGKSDIIPQSKAALLAIADKIDNLCSLIAAGERATSSKDPYALRRQALGVITIILGNNFDINLKDLVHYNLTLLKNHCKIDESIETLILSFILERFKYKLKKDYNTLTLDGVLADCKEYNLLFLRKKLDFIEKFLTTEQGRELLVTYKRISNISSNKIIGNIDRSLFTSQYEVDLYNFVKNNHTLIVEFLHKNNYEQIFIIFLNIMKYTDLFLNNVLVNDINQQIAKNRLLLVEMVKNTFSIVAKFDKFLNY